MLKKAIVKKPAKSFQYGITKAQLGQPDYDITLIQHEKYIESLKIAGLSVQVLNADENYPDSTFVEDIAIVNEKLAIITNPGAVSRKGEIISIKPVLEEYYDNLHKILPPGTVDGGDVLKVENHYFIGLTNRTNIEGANQLETILKEYNYTTTKIYLDKILHLKTGISYLGNNIILVWKELAEIKEFKEFFEKNGMTMVISDPNELYSANSLRLNDFVLIPKEYPILHNKLKELDFNILTLSMNEFQKMDGGLSCLSLRF